MRKEARSINGNFFEINISTEDEISVLSSGYLIDKDGDFIPVLQEDHSSFLSEMFQKFTDNEFEYMDNKKAIRQFMGLDFIVYLGMRVSDVISSNCGNTMEGFGIVFIPDEISSLTQAQRNACRLLLQTNKSSFGNYNKISLQIAKGRSFEEITEEEFISEIIQKKLALKLDKC